MQQISGSHNLPFSKPDYSKLKSTMHPTCNESWTIMSGPLSQAQAGEQPSASRCCEAVAEAGGSRTEAGSAARIALSRALWRGLPHL
jgi:hypothetical protein